MKILNKNISAALRAAYILFLTVFVLWVLTAPAFAQTRKTKNLKKQLQNEITLSAGVGIDNTFFPLHLNPIDITVNNGTGSNFDGEILIEAAGNFYRIVNVFVGPLSSKKYSVFTKFETYTYWVKVSIINSSNIVIYDEKINVKANQLKDYHILSVSETPSYMNALKNISISEKRKDKVDYDSYNYGGYSQYNSGEKPGVQVQNIEAGELYSNFACYEPYSLVIINGADASQMSKDQQRALIEYVSAGGALMVSYGGFVSKISTSELAGILPVTIKGSEVFNGSDFYKYAASQSINGTFNEKFDGVSIPLSIGEIKSGGTATLNLTAADGRQIPLIAHSRSGAGIVYYTAFDISQIDIGQIDYLKENISGILKQSEFNKDFKISSLASYFVKFSEKFNRFIIDPPSAFMVLLLLAAFTIIIGPGFYFYIRNKVSMTRLILIPLAISMFFFVIFNYFDIEFMLTGPCVAELDFQLIDNETMKSQLISSVAILMPPMSGGEYNVDMNDATLISTAKGYYSNSESEIIINEDQIKLVHPQMDYRFSKYAMVKQTSLTGKFSVDYAPLASRPAGNAAAKKKSGAVIANIDEELQSYLNASIDSKKTKKLLSIVNNTDLEISNCRVYYGGRIFSFDKLAPGDKIEPSSCDLKDSKQISEHFETICENISERLAKNIAYDHYRYSGDGFIKAALFYIAKNAAKSPILVGYIKKGGAMGNSVKTSGCALTDLGSIAIIKL